MVGPKKEYVYGVFALLAVVGAVSCEAEKPRIAAPKGPVAVAPFSPRGEVLSVNCAATTEHHKRRGPIAYGGVSRLHQPHRQSAVPTKLAVSFPPNRRLLVVSSELIPSRRAGDCWLEFDDMELDAHTRQVKGPTHETGLFALTLRNGLRALMSAENTTTVKTAGVTLTSPVPMRVDLGLTSKVVYRRLAAIGAAKKPKLKLAGPVAVERSDLQGLSGGML